MLAKGGAVSHDIRSDSELCQVCKQLQGPLPLPAFGTRIDCGRISDDVTLQQRLLETVQEKQSTLPLAVILA